MRRTPPPARCYKMSVQTSVCRGPWLTFLWNAFNQTITLWSGLTSGFTDEGPISIRVFFLHVICIRYLRDQSA